MTQRSPQGNVDPSDHTANLLGALAIAVQDNLTEALSDSVSGNPTAAAAILSIGTRPGESVSALSRILGREHSSTVRLIDRLESEGLVRRTQSSDDARKVILELTREGARKFDEILQARRTVLRRRVNALSEDQRRLLHELLDVLLLEAAHDSHHARQICRLCEHQVCRGAACPVGRPFLAAGY